MKGNDYIAPWLVIAMLVGLWQILMWAAPAMPADLPSPARVAAHLTDQRLWLAAGNTGALLWPALMTALLGGAAVGALLGFRRLQPVISALANVPWVVGAPLAALWVDHGPIGGIIVAGLSGMFAIAGAVTVPMNSAVRSFKIEDLVPRRERRLAILRALASVFGAAIVWEYVTLGASHPRRGVGLGVYLIDAVYRVDIDAATAAFLVIACQAILMYQVLRMILLLPYDDADDPPDEHSGPVRKVRI